jgi:hypothetical protein
MASTSWIAAARADGARLLSLIFARGLRGVATALAGIAVFSVTAFAAGSVSVRLEADVLPECAIAGMGGASGAVIAMDAGDIGTPGSRQLAFQLNCNAPFSYSLEARSGALTHGGALAGIPYTVVMHIATDGAAIQDECPGESLKAGHVRCPFTDSGNAVAVEAEGRLTVAWRPPSELPPAGEYSERLTLTLATRY